MEQLLSTPEVIEHVLLQLPLDDLLSSQRVNKFFYTAITGSPRLQHKLFQRPLNTRNEVMRLNPLLNRALAPYFLHPHQKYDDCDDFRCSKPGNASWQYMYVGEPGKPFTLRFIYVRPPPVDQLFGRTANSVYTMYLGGFNWQIVSNQEKRFPQGLGIAKLHRMLNEKVERDMGVYWQALHEISWADSKRFESVLGVRDIPVRIPDEWNDDLRLWISPVSLY